MPRHRWADVKRRRRLLDRPRHLFTAERDGSWWLIRAVDLPGVFTQVDDLGDVWQAAASVTALMLEVPADSFAVAIILDVAPTPTADGQSRGTRPR